jgi:hypothetical protein
VDPGRDLAVPRHQWRLDLALPDEKVEPVRLRTEVRADPLVARVPPVPAELDQPRVGDHGVRGRQETGHVEHRLDLGHGAGVVQSQDGARDHQVGEEPGHPVGR